MILNPMIPIWLMTVLAIMMLLCKRKGIFAYIRQIIIVLLLFAINLRPMLPGDGVKSGQKATDVRVLFVIDNTISMLAEDYDGKGRRIDAAKEDCAYIVEKLEGATFGIISFYNEAGVLSPFTDNSEHIINSIAALNPPEQLYARGSSLNTPKKLMLAFLKQAKEKAEGKVILFFVSDGEITDNSRLTSYKELESYIDGGAVLGYGTETGGKMHTYSYYDDTEELVMNTSVYPYEPAVSRLDEDNLKKLAEDMDIAYVHMTAQDRVDKVLKEIKENQNTFLSDDGDEEGLAGAKDIYIYFAIPLLLMLGLEAILTFRKK
ncbi:MAG: VWA domain-containing protein [Acetatifactor sp.]